MPVNDLFVARSDFTANQQSNDVEDLGSSPVATSIDQRSPRFTYWAIFFVISLVVTGATIEATDKRSDALRTIVFQKLEVSCAVISFMISFLAVMMHVSPVSALMFVGTKFEGGVLFVLTVVWSTLVGVMSGAQNALAVDREGTVVNGNLYFSGWAGFVCMLFLIVNYFKQVYFLHINEELELRSERLNWWIYYTMVSIVLLCSSANVFDVECLQTERKGTLFCNRLIIVIANSGFGVACSILIIGMKFALTDVIPWRAELIASAILFVFNSFTLGLVTSERAPGNKFGNVFFISWICIILSFVLLGATYDKLIQQRREKLGDELVAAQAAAFNSNMSFGGGIAGQHIASYFNNRVNPQEYQMSHHPEKPHQMHKDSDNQTYISDSQTYVSDSQTYVSDASSQYSGAPKKDGYGFSGDQSVGGSSYGSYSSRESASTYGYPKKDSSGYSASASGTGSYSTKSRNDFSRSQAGGSRLEQIEEETMYSQDASVWSEESHSLKKGYNASNEDSMAYSLSHASSSIQKRTPYSSGMM